LKSIVNIYIFILLVTCARSVKSKIDHNKSNHLRVKSTADLSNVYAKKKVIDESFEDEQLKI
jgi:hypothetical protein